jgi:large subunit ribosomal protein L15
MNLHTLKSSNKTEGKRVGRGEGSGKGQQSGRGHKGQKAGSGYSRKRGFEGGQMPLQRRIPKFGFKNPFRTEYTPLNLNVIQKHIDAKNLSDKISVSDLVSAGLVDDKALVKILGNGDLKSKISITAHAWSKSAEEKITKAGGNIEKA